MKPCSEAGSYNPSTVRNYIYLNSFPFTCKDTTLVIQEHTASFEVWMVGFWPPESGEEGTCVPICTLTLSVEEGPGRAAGAGAPWAKARGCEGWGSAGGPVLGLGCPRGPSGGQDAEHGARAQLQ